ncbi:MAG: response regulator transcription factor [Coriobacteriales bacterium]|jgi:DNA-binding response OmpR family regulator|nr:response regulator transcription factor [Coriobacteriales bacterium]
MEKKPCDEEAPVILLVEDNLHILKVNRAMLEKFGYRVLCARTTAEVRTLIREHTCDLLVLDIMLPDGDGRALCRELRAPQDAPRGRSYNTTQTPPSSTSQDVSQSTPWDTTTLPILFLSAKGENSDIVAGLRAGGDDYLAKPYSLSVLLARVEALLRRAEKHPPLSSQQVLRRGLLTLEIAAMRALVYGNDLLLTPKEFLVLLALVENEGRTLGREALYQRVWGQPIEGDNQALYAVISRLKKKLSPYADSIRLMAVRHDGYRVEMGEN